MILPPRLELLGFGMATPAIVLAAAIVIFGAASPGIAQTPNPQLTVSAPSEVPIGEDFTFTITFSNSTPNNTTVGFGAFIDLVLDSGGADHNNPPPGGGGPCDGIQIVSADLVGVGGGPVSIPLLTTAAPCGGTVPLAHPFGSSPFGPVVVPTSSQMTTLDLIFGSYVSTQPARTIKVKAHVHNFADVGHPLFIYARAGFRYGGNGTVGPPILTDSSLTASAWTRQAAVTPVLFTIKKTYLFLEGETATGSNNPQKYAIEVDLAPGQTITDLVVTDCLEPNMIYAGLDTVATTPGYSVLATPPNPCLKLKYPSVTGGAGPDINVVFSFYIPRLTNLGNVLDPDSCWNKTSSDDIKLEGDWVALDPRDVPGQHIVSDLTPQDDVITDKRFALQKSVALLPPSIHVIPGAILRYTLRFQLSDFFTVGGIVVTDVLSDGQTLVTSPPGLAPRLTVRDRRGPTATVVPFSITLGNLLDSPNPPADPPADCGDGKGGRTLVFKASLAMQNNPSLFASSVLQQGILTGGQAFPPISTIPASGEIVFHARIEDVFTYPHPGDRYVDKDDPLTDCTEMRADIYSNEIMPVMKKPQLTCSDDSKVSVIVSPDKITKSVYAITRGSTLVCGPGGPACSNSLTAPADVYPGDKVTFRIEKTIWSSDAEQVTVEDFLPLPFFDVSDPDADSNTVGPPWVFTNSAGGLPPFGSARLGPSDTLHTLVTPTTPVFTADPTTNSIKFDYGTFNDPANHARKIDLLFSCRVTLKPFADGLKATNESQECEGNTFEGHFCQSAIARVNVRQPNLRIRKGVVATGNTKGMFTPALTPTGKWLPFGVGPSCPRFSAPINSTNLGGLIDSNLNNVDANDDVIFAIAVENIGGAPAFDVELVDGVPVNTLNNELTCFVPDFSTLCVRRGNGAAIPFTAAPPPGAPSSRIINLGLSLTPNSPTSGTNIAIITFKGRIIPKIMPGCCDNTVTLQHYASQPGGPDFASAGFTPPFTDVATLCVNPTLVKSLVATSEMHTTPQISTMPQTPANTPTLAIGEIARFRLAIGIPEGGQLLNFQVTDALPAGMKFMNDGTARLAFISSSSTGIDHPALPNPAFNVIGDEGTLPGLTLTPAQTIPPSVITVGPNCGDDPTFNLGAIKNNDNNDSDLEFVVIEFNALVCNLPVNQSGVEPSNTFSLSADGKPFGPSNAIAVRIVEPNVVVQKTISPPDPTARRNFTVTLANTGTTDAFDVFLKDTLPPAFNLLTVPAPAVAVSPPGCAAPTLSVLGPTLMVNVPRLRAAPACTVTLTFDARHTINCGTNVATVRSSSLPGNTNNPHVGTQPNNTGSSTPCLLSNQEDCERLYNTMGQASIGTFPPSSLVSWWPLDETSGNTLVDIKNAHNATLPANIGSASGVQPSVPAKVVNALFFPNSSANVPGAPYNFGTGNFSIDAWVKTSANTGAALGIIDKLDTSTTLPAGFAFFVLNGKVQLVMGNTSFASPPTAFTFNNVWYHVAVTVQRTGAGSPIGRFYFNGAPAGTFIPPLSSVNNGAPLQIGTYHLNIGPCQSCQVGLDEVEIFGDVVSANEIKAIYDAGSLGKCRP
jgi:uncharacterized repeat protein (TIGR01451 family)